MKPSNAYVVSNCKTKAYVTYIPILLHHFQLIFRYFIHGNLSTTCQHRIKGF